MKRNVETEKNNVEEHKSQHIAVTIVVCMYAGAEERRRKKIHGIMEHRQWRRM